MKAVWTAVSTEYLELQDHIAVITVLVLLFVLAVQFSFVRVQMRPLYMI